MIKTRFVMVMIVWVLAWAFFGCSSTSTTPVDERISLDLSLRVGEWEGYEVNKAALIAHDASGAVLNYKIFNLPENETYTVLFENVPVDGYITVLTNSNRHLTWPAESDYNYTVMSTFPVSAVQKYDGSFYASYYFAYLIRPSRFSNTRLQLQGTCPDGALYLSAEAYAPSGDFWYTSSNPCENGSIDASFWSTLQDNGKTSLVLWPTAEYSWNYIEPLSYLAFMDAAPDDTYTFAADDFTGDVQTAQIAVNDAPEDAVIRYDLTAMKGGVPLLGFSPSVSQNVGNTALAHFANVLDSVDVVYQNVEVSYNGGRTTRFRAVSANAFNPNDSWNLDDFFSLPDAEGLSLQQNPRLVVNASSFGDGNVWATYRVRTIDGGDNPTYIYWIAYDQPGTTLSHLQFSYPELPDALNTHIPDINSDYVSVSVSGSDYDPLDNTFREQGRSREAYRLIRDNLTSTAGANALSLDEPGVRQLPFQLENPLW